MVMKKIFSIVCFLMLLTASVFAADEKQFWVECYKGGTAPVEGWVQDLYCSINYGTKLLHDASMDNSDSEEKVFLESFSSENWNEIIDKISSYVVTTSVHWTLLSDLEFLGYDESEEKCKSEYDSYSKKSVNFFFYGKNHRIKNFCQQASHYAGFFKYFDNASIRDVEFDNAYIILNNDNELGPRSMGAVVVDSVAEGEFTNVKVKNSKVVLNSATDALISNYVGGLVAHAENARFEGNVLEDVVLTGTDKDVSSGSIVYVGGLAAYNSFYKNQISVIGNRVAVQIEMPYTSELCVGGLIGMAMVDANGFDYAYYIRDNKVSPRTSVTGENADLFDVIKLTAGKMVEVNAGGLVGRMKVASNTPFPKMLANSVTGGISVAATSFTDDATAVHWNAVGGILGYVESNATVEIHGHGSIGNISVSKSAQKLYSGYMAGCVRGAAGFSGNFHYGTKDDNVSMPVGFLGDSENRAEAISWTDNYRNAVGSLESNLKLSFVESDIKNPILDDENMKSRMLAYIMNVYGKSTDSRVFWETDDTNGGLPYMTKERTVYKVALDVSEIREQNVSVDKDLVLSKFSNLKTYFNNDEKTSQYVVLTDRNGRVPAEYVDAYESDVVKNGYALMLDGLGAVLRKPKTYGFAYNGERYPDEYIYSVVHNIPVNVSYKYGNSNKSIDFDGISELLYVPSKVSKINFYDDGAIIPRIFKKEKDGYDEYILTEIQASCVGSEKNPQTYDYHKWYAWNFQNVFGMLFDALGSCDSSIDLSMFYNRGYDVAGYNEKQFYVASNDDSANIRVSVYGHDGEEIGEIRRDDLLGRYNESVLWGSLYKFSVAPGYSATKPMEMNVWYVNTVKYDLMKSDLFRCADAMGGFKAIEHCADSLQADFLRVDSAPSYVGEPEEIRQAMDKSDLVRWSVSLDSAGMVSLDSLMIGFFRNKDADMTDAAVIFAPKPHASLILYNVSFMLDDTTGVVDPNWMFEDDHVYSWGDSVVYCADDMVCVWDMIHDVYRNDGCVVGWMPKDADNSILKFGLHERFDADSFEIALKPGKSTLYPIWAPAGVCAEEKLSSQDSSKWTGAHVEGTFTRTVIDAVGADIQIIDKLVYPGESEDSTIRNVGYSKSLLLPTVYNGPDYYRILKFSAKDGFEAPDSMTFYYDLSRRPTNVDFSNNLAVNTFPFTEKIMKFANGDTLPNNLYYSVLEGEFTMVNTTPLAFVDTLVEVVGSIVRIKASTTEFAAGRDAELLITFMDNLGNLIDTTRKLVHETPYVLDTTYFVQPGSYVVLGLMSDALDSTASFAAIANVAADIPVAKDVWQMVSLNPVDMSAVGKDDDQVFYRWDDEAEVGEFWHYLRFLPGDDVESAGGYWYSSLEGRPLKFSDSYKDSVYDIEWNLVNGYSGWNMVGNPHNWNVKVPDDLEIVMWDPATGDYAPNRGYLKPFEAAWVRVEKNRKVSVNGDPYFVPDSLADAAAAKKRALVKTKNAENWTIRAILADNKGKMDSWNILGMGDAQEGFEPPAGMGDIVSFAVKDGKKYLAKSVKAAPASSADSAALEWDVLLSASSDRKGKLYFEGLEGIESYGYHLYVTVDGRTSELTAGDTLAVALKAASTTAKVRVTKEKLYFRTAVESLRMVQAGNKLNVGFTATENLDGARMVVDILDMDGKVVSTYSARAASGSNAVSLDAPKSGLYMLRVRVASQQAAGKILVK